MATMNAEQLLSAAKKAAPFLNWAVDDAASSGVGAPTVTVSSSQSGLFFGVVADPEGFFVASATKAHGTDCILLWVADDKASVRDAVQSLLRLLFHHDPTPVGKVRPADVN